MTNGEKIMLAMLLLRYLANEETTHHIRRFLAEIAYDLLRHNDTPVSTTFSSTNDANDIPF